jgi:murein peptide amidase A
VPRLCGTQTLKTQIRPAKFDAMRAAIPARRTALPVVTATFSENTGPVESFLAPLLRLAETSDSLIAGSVGEFSIRRARFHIPRLIFMGPGGGGDTVRLGIFAALDGDDHVGPEAIGALLQELEAKSDLATGYHLYTYPICNPSGFASGTRRNAAGHDLTTHFWNGSDQPEAYYLEREMGVHHFHGVISLRAGENPAPRFFFSGGQNSTLLTSLASSSMPASQLFPAESKPKGGNAAGFLARTDELRPVPFEVNIEIPRRNPRETQVTTAVNALRSILDSYRSELAIQQDL